MIPSFSVYCHTVESQHKISEENCYVLLAMHIIIIIDIGKAKAIMAAPAYCRRRVLSACIHNNCKFSKKRTMHVAINDPCFLKDEEACNILVSCYKDVHPECVPIY